jgi:uncharacterized protein YutE (UPF0331/DUF86 family)
MSPRRLDPDSVAAKLRLMEPLLDRLADVVGVTGVPVPEDYRSSFAAAASAGAIPDDLARRLAPSAGPRNRLAHRYGEVDLDIVAAAVPLAHADYGEYVRRVSAWLLRASGEPAG